MTIWAIAGKSGVYDGVRRLLLGLGFGRRSRGVEADQVEFAAIEQFPLHLITGLQPDGRSQGQRKADVETRSLTAGADGLNTQGINHEGMRLF